MTAITRSRLVTVLALAAAVGCSEPFDTPPNEPSQPGTGLIVIPQNATIRAGQVVALKATLRDQYGNQLAGMTVSWKSSNEGVATVAPNGEVLVSQRAQQESPLRQTEKPNRRAFRSCLGRPSRRSKPVLKGSC
jgi:hypothetical protein